MQLMAQMTSHPPNHIQRGVTPEHVTESGTNCNWVQASAQTTENAPGSECRKRQTRNKNGWLTLWRLPEMWTALFGMTPRQCWGSCKSVQTNGWKVKERDRLGNSACSPTGKAVARRVGSVFCLNQHVPDGEWKLPWQGTDVLMAWSVQLPPYSVMGVFPRQAFSQLLSAWSVPAQFSLDWYPA